MTDTTDEVVQSAVDKLVGLKTYYVYAREEVTYRVKIQAHDDDEAWEIAHDHSYGLDDIIDGSKVDEGEDLYAQHDKDLRRVSRSCGKIRRLWTFPNADVLFQRWNFVATS